MPSPVLSNRALNRATLARQLLLERSPMPVLDAVEHHVGLQAQEPLNPYTGLWSRLEAFEPGTLATLLEQRKVVRIPLPDATDDPVTENRTVNRARNRGEELTLDVEATPIASGPHSRSRASLA